MEEKHPHRGITMHRLSVGGDFPGLLFAVGSMLIFLIAIPALWYLVAGAVVVGLLIAAALRLVRNKPDEFSRLSLKTEVVQASPAREDSIGRDQGTPSNPSRLLGVRIIPLFHPSH
jgi:hypothetical protein